MTATHPHYPDGGPILIGDRVVHTVEGPGVVIAVPNNRDVEVKLDSGARPFLMPERLAKDDSIEVTIRISTRAADYFVTEDPMPSSQYSTEAQQLYAELFNAFMDALKAAK